MKSEDLHEGDEICSDAELLAGRREGDVHADGCPELKAHGIVAGAIESLYTQSVLEPAEEELDLPALTIGLRDDRRWRAPEIAPEGKATGVLEVVESDAAQIAWPVFRSVGPVETSDLVRAKRGTGIHWTRGPHVEANVRPDGDDEEGTVVGEVAQTAASSTTPVSRSKGLRAGRPR